MTFSRSFVACGAIAASLAASGTVATAQTATPSARLQNDARIQECSRYSRAYVRLEGAKNDIDRLKLAFLESDPVRDKVIEIVTQLNDAEITVRKRVASCPAQFRV